MSQVVTCKWWIYPNMPNLVKPQWVAVIHVSLVWWSNYPWKSKLHKLNLFLNKPSQGLIWFMKCKAMTSFFIPTCFFWRTQVQFFTIGKTTCSSSKHCVWTCTNHGPVCTLYVILLFWRLDESSVFLLAPFMKLPFTQKPLSRFVVCIWRTAY
jgi:hypothetical protein